MSTEIWEGFFAKRIPLKHKRTGTFENVWLCWDNSKLIGIFWEEFEMNRFWRFKYIPSRRTELYTSDIWQYSEEDIARPT